MPGRVALVIDDRLTAISFAPHPLKSKLMKRYKILMELLEKTSLIERVDFVKPEVANEIILREAHHLDYIDFIKMANAIGIGYVDKGETPIYRGMFEDSLYIVGATMTAGSIVVSGKYDHVFNPNGGHCHAKYLCASNYNIFNDVAILAKTLFRKYKWRILILDISGTHADGTQEILYSDPILKISIHRRDRIYGSARGGFYEIGDGRGYGYNINIPLPYEIGDDCFIEVFDELVVPIVESFRPQIIIFVAGQGGNMNDPIVGWELTYYSYINIAKKVHELSHKYSAGRLICLGGDGLNPWSTAMGWLFTLAELCKPLPEELEENINAIIGRWEPTTTNPAIYKKVRYIMVKIKNLIREIMGYG